MKPTSARRVQRLLARRTARAVALGVAIASGTALAQPAPEPQPPPTETAPPEPGAPPPTTGAPPGDPQRPQPPPNYPPPPPGYPQPPPNYPPPPPGYPPYGPPAYPGYYQPYYPPPAGRAAYRPFMLSLGLGVGTLHFRDLFGVRTSEVGLSYTLRVGFGITRSWLLFLGAEGTGVTHQQTGFWQTAYVLGAQAFVLGRIYFRAGFGLASATAQGDVDDLTGVTALGAAGFELAQGYSTSLALEVAVAGARYSGESWANTGFNFVLNFY